MKYLVAFVAIAALVSGCIITDYPIITDDSFARLWWGAVVETNGLHIGYYAGAGMIGTSDDEGLLHWTEFETFIDQDFEGNQTIYNWGSWVPWYDPLSGVFRYNNVCRSMFDVEAKATNSYAYTRADGVFVEYEAPRWCMAAWSDNPVFRPGSTITPAVFDYVRNLECPAQGISLLVSYFGHTIECDGVTSPMAEKVENFKMNAFDKVEILNELASKGILDSGVYSYTIKGSDLTIDATAGDKHFSLDLKGVTLPISINEDLSKTRIHMNKAVGMSHVFNQVADVSEEVGARTPLTVNINWKGISKIATIGLAEADAIRDLGKSYSQQNPAILK
jgi:hypothetical protein